MYSRLVSILVALMALATCACAVPTKVVVDLDSTMQSWEGWGATDGFAFDCLEVEPEARNLGKIPTEVRRQALKLYYHDLGMNFVRFHPSCFEPANDNDDPRVINPAGFNWSGRGMRPNQGLDPFCEDHLVMGKAYRTRGEPFVFYPMANEWESWMSATPGAEKWWSGRDGRFNPEMAEELAEHAVAMILRVRERYGYELPYLSLFNEPSNCARPSKETWLALVLACGRRFHEYDLATKLVICDDVTPEASAEAIEYVLGNEEAMGYVGAISYHRYCGDFVIERVKPMLRKVDKGELLVKEPVSFYASARKYGKSVWLSEQTSYGDNGITLFDAGRARANHICDEINHGRVNAFNFMLTCFIERGKPGHEESAIFLRSKDGKCCGAEINDFGWWISQFTRYIRPGAVAAQSGCGDPLIKTVAFRHQGNSNVTVVVVNNHPETVPILVSIKGNLKLAAKSYAVRTQPGTHAIRLPVLECKSGAIADVLPATSVTTYVVRTLK